MAKITYTDKETLNEIPSIPAKNKVQAADMNEIKNAVNQNELKVLLIVDSSAPAECSTGDMYYNTTTKLIYTATGTNTWGSTGVNPTQNTLYIDNTNKSTYFYDGSDLISVGGGAGGETLPVGSEIDFDGQVSDIPSGWEQVSGKTYVAYDVWTNSSPTSAFAEQTIQLDLSTYSYVEITYKVYSTDDLLCNITKVYIGTRCKIIQEGWQEGVGEAILYRLCGATTTGISFGNEVTVAMSDGLVKGNYNSWLIPIKIIGYKEV